MVLINVIKKCINHKTRYGALSHKCGFHTESCLLQEDQRLKVYYKMVTDLWACYFIQLKKIPFDSLICILMLMLSSERYK